VLAVVSRYSCVIAWVNGHSHANVIVPRATFWDIGTAVRFTEGLGYKGLYSIEVARHEGVRIVYNTILANLA